MHSDISTGRLPGPTHCKPAAARIKGHLHCCFSFVERGSAAVNKILRRGAEHCPVGATLRMALVGGIALFAAPILAAQLPLVCVAGSCGPNGPTAWLGAGQATATSVANTLTIRQTSEQAILNWASFNVSADGRVIFTQPDSSAIALNRIFQASPSQIFGLVQANGQLYLVNQNGFIFGPTAQVNVGGLLASTLQITD